MIVVNSVIIANIYITDIICPARNLVSAAKVSIQPSFAKSSKIKAL